MDYLSGEVRLHYQAIPTAGNVDKGVVVLLHPTPVDGRFWRPVADLLASDFRVLIPDLRGHGASESGIIAGTPSDTIRIDTLAQDVVRMLDHAGVHRASFAGCSIGSYTLFALWQSIPDRIQAMAFCCGKPHADTETARNRRLETIANLEQQGTEPFFASMLAALVGKWAQQTHPERQGQLLEMMMPMTVATAVAVQKGLGARPDARATAAGITASCAVLAGQDDSAATVAEMEELYDLLPRATWHLLPELGHYAPFEDPARVGTILREFFVECAGEGK